MEDLTGKELGQYRIVSPFGEGGMAAVYKAFQPGTERYVALKILPRHYSQDPAFQARFQQEAQIIARLQHPHILPVFDYGEEDGYAFLAMPLLKGGNLAQLMGEGPLSLPQIRQITTQVADALDYAHAYGIVHRDIKPSNILIDERKNALLADFGIAKIVGSMVNITGTGQIIGTPAYMSPEQIRGSQLDGRSDIYSLGIVLYEMVTGRTPFRAETPPALFVKHLLDPLPPPSKLKPDVPPAVEQVILKSLAKDPDLRYRSGQDMSQAIREAIPADGRMRQQAPAEAPISAEQETIITGSAAAEAPAPASIPKAHVADPSAAAAPAAGTPSSRGKSIIWGVGLILLLVVAGLLAWNILGTPLLGTTGPAGETNNAAALNTDPALIGYWPFDEGSGSITQDAAPAGHENEGALQGEPAWSQGQFGQALRFDRQRQQSVIVRDNEDLLSIPDGGLTLSAWIRPDVVSGELAIVAKDKFNASARGNYFLAVTDGYLQFGFQPQPTGIDVTIQSAEPLIEPGQWAFVAAAFTFGRDEKPALYVDGAAVPLQEWEGSGDQANMPFIHQNPLYIGQSEANGMYFAGVIDDVRIYARQLDAAEIAALYQQLEQEP